MPAVRAAVYGFATAEEAGKQAVATLSGGD